MAWLLATNGKACCTVGTAGLGGGTKPDESRMILLSLSSGIGRTPFFRLAVVLRCVP